MEFDDHDSSSSFVNMTSSGAMDMETLQRDVALLTLENMLLNSFWDRAASHLVQDIVQEDLLKKKGNRKGRGTKYSEEISMEQKIEIAISEVSDAKKQIEERREMGDKLLDDLKAFIEEADVKIAELRKEHYEFKRDVVQNSSSTSGGKPPAERVLRWMEEQQRVKETITEKLNVKNAQLKVMIQKQETQLHLKEEMGEVLHVIDFDQLKIENQQYLKKIEERNAELLQLKLTTGNIVQVLNSSKRKLSSVVSESSSLRNMILEKEELLKRVLEEVEKVEVDKAIARKFNGKISKQIDESAMPQILEYVEQKATAFNLDRELNNLIRKIEIAEMEVRRYKSSTTAATKAVDSLAGTPMK